MKADKILNILSIALCVISVLIIVGGVIYCKEYRNYDLFRSRYEEVSERYESACEDFEKAEDKYYNPDNYIYDFSVEYEITKTRKENALKEVEKFDSIVKEIQQSTLVIFVAGMGVMFVSVSLRIACFVIKGNNKKKSKYTKLN